MGGGALVDGEGKELEDGMLTIDGGWTMGARACYNMIRLMLIGYDGLFAASQACWCWLVVKLGAGCSRQLHLDTPWVILITPWVILNDPRLLLIPVWERALRS